MSNSTSPADRWLAAIREIVRQEVASTLKYSGIYEYQVIASSNNTVDGLPVDGSKGLPPVQGIQIRAGLPGTSCQLQLGAHVAIGFLDQNPAKPYVFGIFDSTGALTITVTSLSIALGDSGAAPLAHASWISAIVTALFSFAGALSSSVTLANVIASGNALGIALNAVVPSPTTKVTAE